MSASIFISYSSKDLQTTEKIEENLQTNGCKIWRDKSKIRDDWSREIADALSNSDIVLVIWSENSSKSNWVKNEWLTARALGKPIKLVIISDFTNLPKPLANMESMVFKNDIDFDIQKVSEKLKEIKSFHQDYDYNILPSKINIPFSPNLNFTGRDREMINLYLEIIGNLNKLNYNTVGINGIGGVGKTQLAIEFFYRYAFAFDKGIFWIDGSNPSKWLEQIASIARDRLELIIKEDVTDKEKEKRYYIAFQSYCRESGNGSKMLLIVDNVIDPLDMNKDNIFFPEDSTSKFTLLTLGCNILFTTRRDFEGKLPNAIEHRLQNLSPDSAYELLTKYRKPNSIEVKYFKNICNSVGYLPLAIVLIGGYLYKYSDITVQEYYEEHIKDKLGSIDLDQISTHELATRHVSAVRTTFEPDWKILEKDLEQSLQEIQNNQNAKKIVSILTLFPESAIIPKNRLIIYSGIEKFGKTKLIRPAQSAINLLDELNLIDILEDGNSMRIHPLLREFVHEKLRQDEADNKILKLKSESMINLKNRYCDDFPYLVNEYTKERDGNIDSILEDLKTVIEWSREEKSWASNEDNMDVANSINSSIKINYVTQLVNELVSLNQILVQESHNLRTIDKNSLISSLPTTVDRSSCFALQVNIRSADLSNMVLMEKSRRYLEAKNSSIRGVRWARIKDKSAVIRTLDGHGDFVDSVAITPDGTKIVSGSHDKTIRVWDIATGQEIKKMGGHADAIRSVAITPDGIKIVSCSFDRTIRVWDIATGQEIKKMGGHTGGVSSVAITPDGTKAVSGSQDHTVRMWDIATGQEIKKMGGHTDTIDSVAITPDGTKIVSGSQDHTVRMWDIATGQEIKKMEGHTGWVSSVAITPDGTKIVSGSHDKTIRVWDIATGQEIKKMGGHTGWVSSVAITPDGTKIVSGSFDMTIRVWDIVTGQEIKKMGGMLILFFQ